MKLTIQSDDKSNALVLQSEFEAEDYQINAIARTCEMKKIKMVRWKNEMGRGITIKIADS